MEAVELVRRFKWNLIPLQGVTTRGGCTCGNPECKAPGKHPQWPKWNSRLLDSISFTKRFLDQGHIGGNLGLPTGKDNDVVILDIDGDKGFESLERLEEEIGPLPDTLRVKTARGLHIYVRHFEIKNVVGVLPGLDIRSEGGQVVFVGSEHSSGHIYSVLSGNDVLRLTETQQKHLQELSTKPKSRREKNVSTHTDQTGSGFWEVGTRHNLALGIGGMMARKGIGLEDAEDRVLAICEQYGDNEQDDRIKCVRDAYAMFETDPAKAPTKRYALCYADEQSLEFIDEMKPNYEPRLPKELPLRPCPYADELKADRKIKETERLVYQCLDSQYSVSSRQSRAFQDDIALTIGKSVRTVQRALESLRKKGLVYWFGQWEKGRNDKREANIHYLAGRWLPEKDLKVLINLKGKIRHGKTELKDKTAQMLEDVSVGFIEKLSKGGVWIGENAARRLLPAFRRFVRFRKLNKCGVEAAYLVWVLDGKHPERIAQFINTYKNAVGYWSPCLEDLDEADPCGAYPKESEYWSDKTYSSNMTPSHVLGFNVEDIKENYESVTHFLNTVNANRISQSRERLEELDHWLPIYRAKERIKRTYNIVKRSIVEWIDEGKFLDGWHCIKSLLYYIPYGTLSWGVKDGVTGVRLRGKDFDQTFYLKRPPKQTQGRYLLHGDGTVDQVA